MQETGPEHALQSFAEHAPGPEHALQSFAAHDPGGL